MLCPTCKTSSAGGSVCPQCLGPIPDQETFEGQGGHYLRFFAFVAVGLFVGATTVGSIHTGQPFRLDLLLGFRWFWLYLIICFLPVIYGVHYWYMLRGEQVRVTDEYIERISHWGNERVLWADVSEYRRQVLPFRETRLGRVARLSRWLTRGRFVAHIPPYAYDLIATNAAGERQLFRLEPGSVTDVVWLLALIEEHAGEPQSA